MGTSKRINIVLADDHQLVRKGLAQLLSLFESVNTVYEAANGEEVLNIIARSPVDLAVLDIEMPIMNGIVCATRIRDGNLPVKVLMLTMLNNASLIRQVMAAGASGFVYKNASEAELQMAISSVMSGEQYISKDAMHTLLSAEEDMEQDMKKLSVREIEIVKLVAAGMSSKAIGEKLFISPRTADTHRANIMAKLGIHTLQELTKFALEHGLV